MRGLGFKSPSGVCCLKGYFVAQWISSVIDFPGGLPKKSPYPNTHHTVRSVYTKSQPVQVQMLLLVVTEGLRPLHVDPGLTGSCRSERPSFQTSCQDMYIRYIGVTQ